MLFEGRVVLGHEDVAFVALGGAFGKARAELVDQGLEIDRSAHRLGLPRLVLFLCWA